MTDTKEIIGTLYSVEWLNEETMGEAEEREPGTYVTIKVPDDTIWFSGKFSIRHIARSPQPTCPNGWQPISTAPKDGTWILGWSTRFTDYQPRRVSWGKSPYGDLGWGTENEFLGETITHWMPLPAAPTEARDE